MTAHAARYRHGIRGRRSVHPMPCLALILALISPRLALFATWLLSDILGRAYDGWLLPLRVAFAAAPPDRRCYAAAVAAQSACPHWHVCPS